MSAKRHSAVCRYPKIIRKIFSTGNIIEKCIANFTLFRNLKMAENQPAIIQEAGQPTVDTDSPLMSLEGSLLSMEKLDRASPELWPEQIPGLSGYAPLQSPNQPPAQWNTALSSEDITLMNQLGALSTSNIILEVKKLHDLAYRLGVEEAKEMTRGKYLNVFTSKKNYFDY